jgi:hypothetical protein
VGVASYELFAGSYQLLAAPYQLVVAPYAIFAAKEGRGVTFWGFGV